MACLEKNQVLREKAAQIVVHMIKNKLLPIKSYLCGLEEVLEFADDLRVDIPKMWEYLADLIGIIIILFIICFIKILFPNINYNFQRPFLRLNV